MYRTKTCLLEKKKVLKYITWVFTFSLQKKKKQIKPKTSRRKEIMKDKVKINEIENKNQ